MEAASVTARPIGATTPLAALRSFVDRFGLIIVLAIGPLFYAVHDLVVDGNLNRIGNNLVAGISNGSIWALVALGYTLVYGIIELINFAHGDLFMIGSFVGYGMFGTIGLTLTTSP